MAEKSPENPGSSQARSQRAEPVPPPRNLLGEVDPTRDVFVRQVLGVFNATVVKITVPPAVQVAITERDDGDE